MENGGILILVTCDLTAVGATKEHNHHVGHRHGDYKMAGDHVLQSTQCGLLHIARLLEENHNVQLEMADLNYNTPDIEASHLLPLC